MVGGATHLALNAAATDPHHIDAKWGLFDPIHITYEPFAIENIEITPHGTPDFGREHRYKILNHAEYISGGYLELTFPIIDAPAGTTPYYRVAWIHNIGIYCYDEIDFVVNNNKLDKQYPEYMDWFWRLTLPEGKKAGFNDMIGEMNIHSTFSHGGMLYNDQFDIRAPQVKDTSKAQFKTILPLNFWWCLDWTQAIPIGILVFSEVWIYVKFKPAYQLYNVYENDSGTSDPQNLWPPSDEHDLDPTIRLTTTPRLVEAKLFIDYVYLPNAARDRISKQSHFYVITQCKHTGSVPVSSRSHQFKLPYVLPITNLIWGIREDDATRDKEFYFFDKYHGNSGDAQGGGAPYNIADPLIEYSTIKLLAEDRQQERHHLYYTRYVPFKHANSIPRSHGIHMWCPALRPFEAQSSGVLNLSASEQNYLNIRMKGGIAPDGTTADSGIGGNAGKTGELFVFAEASNYIFIKNGYITPMYNG